VPIFGPPKSGKFFSALCTSQKAGFIVFSGPFRGLFFWTKKAQKCGKIFHRRFALEDLFLGGATGKA
jgi:hypothetical protein